MSVFVVLGLIWAAVLIPPVLRARAERRAEFIDSFREQMGALGDKARAGRAIASTPSSGRRPVRRRPVSAMKRRRDILGGMVGALIGSLLLGAVPSLRLVWVLHLFLLNLFLGYVALLTRQRQLAARRHGYEPSPARDGSSVTLRRRRLPKPALAPVLPSRR